MDALPKFEKLLSSPLYQRASQCCIAKDIYESRNRNRKKSKYIFPCNYKFCPICARMKARERKAKLLAQLLQLKKEEMSVLILGLSAPNVTGSDLKQEVRVLQKAVTILVRRIRVKQIYKGYFRKLEITYRSDMEEYNPHIHLFLFVRESYFTDSRIYISKEKWLNLWKEATSNFCVENIEVKGIRLHERTEEEIDDIVSYYTKAMEYWRLGEDALQAIMEALKGCREVTYTGILNDVLPSYGSKEKLQNNEKSSNDELVDSQQTSGT